MVSLCTSTNFAVVLATLAGVVESNLQSRFCVWRCSHGSPNGCFIGTRCPELPQVGCQEKVSESFSSMEICQKFRESNPSCNDGCEGLADDFQEASELNAVIQNNYELQAWVPLSASVSRDIVLIGLGSEPFSVQSDMGELLQAFRNYTNASGIALSVRAASAEEAKVSTAMGSSSSRVLHEIAEVSYGDGELTTVYVRWVQAPTYRVYDARHWLAETVLVPSAAFKAVADAEVTTNAEAHGTVDNVNFTELFQQRNDVLTQPPSSFGDPQQLPSGNAMLTQMYKPTLYYANLAEQVRQRNARLAQLYNMNMADQLAKEMWSSATTMYHEGAGQFTADDDLKSFVSRRVLGENIELSTIATKVMPDRQVVHELGSLTAAGGAPMNYYARWVMEDSVLRLNTHLFFFSTRAKLLLI